MAFARKLAYSIDDKGTIILNFAYTGDENSLGNVEIAVLSPTTFPGAPILAAKLKWMIDEDARALLFDPASIVQDPTVQCIAQCLGIAVGKGLIECVWKNRKNLKGLEDCLKEKAVGVLLDSSECVARCLGLASIV